MEAAGIGRGRSIRVTLGLMNLNDFQDSLAQDMPPEGLSDALLALWWDANGNWARAHGFAQDDTSVEGSWVHAYLHRVEGDLSNAGYWYRRAGKPASRAPLADEWREIAGALL